MLNVREARGGSIKQIPLIVNFTTIHIYSPLFTIIHHYSTLFTIIHIFTISHHYQPLCNAPKHNKINVVLKKCFLSRQILAFLAIAGWQVLNPADQV